MLDQEDVLHTSKSSNNKSKHHSPGFICSMAILKMELPAIHETIKVEKMTPVLTKL